MDIAPAVEREAVAPLHAHHPLISQVTATAIRRVLVAEDNAGMLQVLTRVLRREGFDVVQAQNGLELMHWLERIRQWRDAVPLFDLVVTDLRMPMFTGQQFLEELATIEDRTPVILISAFADPQVQREALAKGARAVLAKPLDVDDLLDQITRILP